MEKSLELEAIGERQCANCHQTFTQKRWWQRFCTIKCTRQWHTEHRKALRQGKVKA
jgi:hypothetical protein